MSGPEEARRVREGAQEVGGRTLEVFAETPALNAWYYSKLSRHVRGRVLELGSGIGNLSRLLIEDAESLVATEVEEAYLERLRGRFAGDPRVEVLAYDLDHPPPAALSAEPFDVVFSVNVIEHIADDTSAVRALAGLLRPGGRMLTYVPAGSFAYGAMDEALGHHRRYDAPAFAALMRGAGLEVEHLSYMNVVGLLGWIVSGRILRRRAADPRQVALFERLLPLVRLEEKVEAHAPLPFGLGLICHARKLER